jgi:hypothetical protein
MRLYTVFVLLTNSRDQFYYIIMHSMTTQDHDFIINDTKYNLQGIESLAWKKLVNGSVKKKWF